MQDGGTLTVSTANVILNEGDVPPEAGIPPGPYVLLSVTDTGTGMEPEVKARAFEPFFTTKEHGKGTGLGLATIYGFVRQSGGYIALESESGKGTTFRIYLPRLVRDAAASRETAAAARPIAASGETILVVEDNVAVRRVTVERLKALGYRVEEAEDGRRAIERLERGPAPSLVFSDVVMPGGVSGFELAREIARRWPGLNVLLTSGFAADEAAEKGDGLGDMEILGKPYSQDALARAITAALRKART
jgi:CheY-like chemotaxis protein